MNIFIAECSQMSGTQSIRHKNYAAYINFHLILCLLLSFYSRVKYNIGTMQVWYVQPTAGNVDHTLLMI